MDYADEFLSLFLTCERKIFSWTPPYALISLLPLVAFMVHVPHGAIMQWTKINPMLTGYILFWYFQPSRFLGYVLLLVWRLMLMRTNRIAQSLFINQINMPWNCAKSVYGLMTLKRFLFFYLQVFDFGNYLEIEFDCKCLLVHRNKCYCVIISKYLNFNYSGLR